MTPADLVVDLAIVYGVFAVAMVVYMVVGLLFFSRQDYVP